MIYFALIGASMLLVQAQSDAATCASACTAALPAECGRACPFVLNAEREGQDGSTEKTEQMCAPACRSAWTAARGCLSDAGAPEADAIDGMLTACDTLCFLEGGTSLATFQAACGPIFGGDACPADCRALVNVTLDRACRNTVVAAPDAGISGAAAAVFDACGAAYDPVLDCSDACSAELPAACQGMCPFTLMRSSGEYDNEWDDAGVLCSADCRAAWTAPAYIDCLTQAGSQAKLAAVDAAKSQTCPQSCFVAAFELPENQLAAQDCMLLAGNSTAQCTTRCQLLLESLGEECRSSTVASPQSAIAATARTTFDACGVSYEGASAATGVRLDSFTLSVLVGAVAATVLVPKLMRSH